MGVEIKIPDGKGRHIANHNPGSRAIRTPDGTRLSISVPQNFDELRSAWKVLEDYTGRVALNPESKLQDLDDIRKVREYHFGKNFGYVVFSAVDGENRPQAMATAEIVPVRSLVDRKIARGKGISFIYQGAHTPGVSQNDTNFSVFSQLYKVLSGELLPEISKYKGDKWLGAIAESRSSGPELEAILNAGFEEIVPNEFYRPPAVQKVRRRENQFTTDLILLGRGIPKDPKLRELAAEAYVRAAYCEGQNINPTLRAINQYFSARKSS